MRHMETKIRKLRKSEEYQEENRKTLQEAGDILKRGGLVAFPTETVYGLGADALNEEAAKKIYAAKGRPSDNPLIVHITNMAALGKIVSQIPDAARKVAEAYWPGPLTMIFEKTKIVPYGTTGGLETVAVRMPSHPAARAVIDAGGGYIAAPSANTSGRPSPTRAEHVAEDLDGRIEMIVDGGPVEIIPAGYSGYLVLGVIVCSIALMAKLQLPFVWRAMKPMLFMLVFLLVINLLVIHDGYVLLSIGSFHIYSGAVSQTLYIVVRLALMVVITTILTATTKPLDLTLGIEDLLKPFRRIGVPAHEIAMMISIALRFIPTLIEETQRIMKAQASRGVDMSSGSLKEKIGAVLSLIVPLFVSAFDRAEQLANAMEARGYVPGRNRTRYKSLKLHGIDIALLAGSFLLLGVLIAMGALGCA